MGNTTVRTTAPLLARVGLLLGAQRVELFSVRDHFDARLVDAWADGVPAVDAVDLATPIPTGWFPWSLGNIRPERYMFVRNAGALSVSSSGPVTVGDLGMASVLYLPLVGGSTVFGAVCAYWSSERSSWPAESLADVCSIAAEALSMTR